ncbi:hypothetical protein [Clostridium tagluense]|uniref:Uncharacterized protein n=1 Tax=Clostridium tagluense TaxID=360422 RepID=A0A401ULK2_9CLOT|nr:hypothetical protein [Clostridium tagluense]GCD10413.1 hypothetical protein Ctaglu_20360 [Clostridium tagluense]
MSRAKIIENHSIQIEGILDTTTDILTVDVEDVGVKTLKTLLSDFGKKKCKITVRLSEEIVTP